MKLKYLFAASATLTLLLSGCGHSDNKSSDSKEDTKQEAQHKENKTSEKQTDKEGFSEKNSENDKSSRILSKNVRIKKEKNIKRKNQTKSFKKYRSKLS